MEDFKTKVLQGIANFGNQTLQAGGLQNLLGKKLSEQYIFDPVTNRVIPSSPYWSIADANAIKDPKERQKALQNAQTNMVMMMSTGPVSTKGKTVQEAQSVSNNLFKNEGQIAQKQLPAYKFDPITNKVVDVSPKQLVPKVDPLVQEARKYKSAEEFVNVFTDPKTHFQILPNSYLKKPKVVYRGSMPNGGGMGFEGGGGAIEGYGLYTTTRRAVAEGYAKAHPDGIVKELKSENAIPKNPLYFRDSETIKDWVVLSAKKMGMSLPEFNEKIGINKFVNSLGHDGVAFDMNGGTTFVKYPETKSQLTDIYNQATQSK